MKFLMYIAFVAFSVAFVEISASEVTVREFHECVACNDDTQARLDFDSCLKELSPHNKEIMSRCCESTFDYRFCKEAASGTTNYGSICKNPKKGQDVEGCFWKQTNKEHADIHTYMQCRSQIHAKYCTTHNF